MKTSLTRAVLSGFVFALMPLLTISSASAQCATCPAPTVAYQPVAVQPMAVYQPVAAAPYRGWYPGKLLDSLRLRRYGASTYATPYTASYAPYTASYAPYTASYAPYTASYAPYTASYAPYTAGYTPYVTAYAPLATTTVARPFAHTSYHPHFATSGCSTCVQTVARPVILSPVVTASCSSCSVDPCNSCSACSTVPAGVGQASFTQPACSSCTSAPSTPSFATPSLTPGYPSGGASIGPPTPQPQLRPSEPAPSQSNYPRPTPAEGNGTNGLPDALDHVDPLPVEDANSSDTSTYFEAPKLFSPHDRTAQRSSSNGPTVDVWNAVYRKSTTRAVNQTSTKRSRAQAEIDAEGWYAVPRNR